MQSVVNVKQLRSNVFVRCDILERIALEESGEVVI